MENHRARAAFVSADVEGPFQDVPDLREVVVVQRVVRALEVVQLTGKPFSASLPTMEYLDPTTVAPPDEPFNLQLPPGILERQPMSPGRRWVRPRRPPRTGCAEGSGWWARCRRSR